MHLNGFPKYLRKIISTYRIEKIYIYIEVCICIHITDYLHTHSLKGTSVVGNVCFSNGYFSYRARKQISDCLGLEDRTGIINFTSKKDLIEMIKNVLKLDHSGVT